MSPITTHCPRFIRNTSIFCTLFLFLLLLNSSPAKTAEEPAIIRVVSSFPAEMTRILETAFEASEPGFDLEVVKKKTTAGITYIKEGRNAQAVDLFWVSAPDAFEVLKEAGLLRQYRPQALGIPRRLSGFPVNDPEGYYSGFAAAGYGIMINTEYCAEHGLVPPKDWEDITRREYRGHVGLCAPSRSGTTHITMEAILQLKGWHRGWSLIKGMAANAVEITAKSSHVPKGVVAGRFGVGVVIDFYGLAPQAQGEPITFVYPKDTIFVPASIGLVMGGLQPEGAGRFVEFLLSPHGQQLLLMPEISRLPIRPDTYQRIEGTRLAEFFPQPFSARQLGSHEAFDIQKSRQRYGVVNSLFDVMITYNLEALQKAVHPIQDAEDELIAAATAQSSLAGAVARSRDLVDFLPLEELDTFQPELADLFQQRRRNSEDRITGKQGEMEDEWTRQVLAGYRAARRLMVSVWQAAP